jgi:hypothetical protein
MAYQENKSRRGDADPEEEHQTNDFIEMAMVVSNTSTYPPWT